MKKRPSLALFPLMIVSVVQPLHAGIDQVISHTVGIAGVTEFGTYFSDAPFDEGFFVAERPIPPFPKFNPALGTLNSVSLSVSGGSVGYEGFIETAGILDGGQSHFASAGGELALNIVRVEGNSGFLVAFGNSLNPAVGCSGNPGDGDACSEFDSNSEPISFFLFDEPYFSGLGNTEGLRVSLDYPVWMDFDLFNIDNAYADFTFTMDSFDLTIEYNYTPAPKLDADFEVTGPRAGNLTVMSNPGKDYRLRRVTATGVETVQTLSGTGGALVLSFDDAASADTAALFFVEELDAGP